MVKQGDLNVNGNITTNRKARHEYSIVDKWEAGIALVGTEVKAVREGKISIVDSFASIDNSELWLYNLYIAEYERGSWTNHETRRKRKLLMHKREINRLSHKVDQSSFTLIPLSLYFKEGRVKVELALAKGKQEHDKRQSLLEKQTQKDIARVMGRRFKGIH